MIYPLIMLLAFSAVPRKTYPGPMQIAWGTPIVQAHEAFGAKLTLDVYENETINTPEQPIEDGAGFRLEYSGGFGGFEAELIKEIQVGFDAKKQLISFCVEFSPDDERPRSKTFEEIVEMVRDAYGAPDKINEPKDTATRLAKQAKEAKVMTRSLQFSADSAAASKYEERDRMVRAGTWDATAIWRFKDGTVIFASIMTKPKGSGERELQLAWCMMSKGALSGGKKERRDF